MWKLQAKLPKKKSTRSHPLPNDVVDMRLLDRLFFENFPAAQPHNPILRQPLHSLLPSRRTSLSEPWPRNASTKAAANSSLTRTSRASTILAPQSFTKAKKVRIASKHTPRSPAHSSNRLQKDGPAASPASSPSTNSCLSRPAQPANTAPSTTRPNPPNRPKLQTRPTHFRRMTILHPQASKSSPPLSRSREFPSNSFLSARHPVPNSPRSPQTTIRVWKSPTARSAGDEAAAQNTQKAVTGAVKTACTILGLPYSTRGARGIVAVNDACWSLINS
jgi:cell wall-associated NlpC family hydrolase